MVDLILQLLFVLVTLVAFGAVAVFIAIKIAFFTIIFVAQFAAILMILLLILGVFHKRSRGKYQRLYHRIIDWYLPFVGYEDKRLVLEKKIETLENELRQKKSYLSDIQWMINWVTRMEKSRELFMRHEVQIKAYLDGLSANDERS